MSNNYASINFRKVPSPLLINLRESKIIELFPYQTSFSHISNDEKVILIHSEKSLNYHSLSTLERRMTLESAEIPDAAVFADKNTKIFVLYKDTKQIYYYKINLEKNIYHKEYVLQDRDIKEMKVNHDETILLVYSLHCIYCIDLKLPQPRMLHKFKTTDLSRFSNDSFLSGFDTFNGYGCTMNNKILYATLYTYLICYDIQTGQIHRVFQSTLAANRIIKSYSCKTSDILLSLLDNGQIIKWNLRNLYNPNEIKFDDMRIFSSPIIDCCLPSIQFDSIKNRSNVISYSSNSPDLKVHSLSDPCGFNVTKSIVKNTYDTNIDNPLSIHVESCTIDPNGRYCFILNSINDFAGRNLPTEAYFVKKNCSIIDLTQNNRLIEKFTYIVRRNSRFQMQASFVLKSHEVK
jgi:hypothetical protein